MTSEQLEHLLRVLDEDSMPTDDTGRVPSQEWRDQGIHTKPEISLGSYLREKADYGPID